MLKVLGLLLFALGSAGAAQAAPVDEMKAVCYVGTEPVAPGGSMPQHLEGVITIAPKEAKCAIEKFPQLLVVAPMRDLQQLPGAIPVPLLAYPTLDADNLAKAQAAMTELTGGDKARPILVYCHHSSCGYSVEAAKHLHTWGYPNVLWMREGLKGWAQANYPLTPIEQAKSAVGEASWTVWMDTASQSMGCFGEKRVDACDLKVYALNRIFTAPDLPADQRDLVAGQLFNAAAVRAEVMREDKAYGPAKSFPEAELAYKALKEYAAEVGRPGVLAENAKVVREYAVSAIETGRPQLAQTVLTEVRADGLADFKRLDAARKDEKALQSVQGAMVAMEHLERDVADFAIDKAGSWFSEDKRAEAAPYRKLAVDALDRAVLWIERNGKEGVGHMMDLAPEYRLNQVLVKKGDLLLQDKDEAGARTAYGYATKVCGLEDDEYNNYGDACEIAQTKYFLLTDEFKRWSQQQAEKEYEAYMSLLRD